MFRLSLGMGLAAMLAALPAVPCAAEETSTTEVGRDDDRPSLDERVQQSAAAGSFLPFTMAPRTDSQRAYGRVIGGYNSATRSSQFEGTADVTIFGPLAVRAGVMSSEEVRNRLRPTIGLRVQALSQDKQWLDLTIGAFYKPEGFTESEGEVEFVLALGRRFGRLGTFANLVFGQDPEGAERDGEVRVAAQYELTNVLQAGLDGRLRVDLASENGKRRAGDASYDLVVGPLASWVIGPVAAIAQVGVSALGQESNGSRAGAIALLGLGGAL